MIKIIDNIILLGTSHVSENSAREIKETIDKFNPDVVGIELDFNRLKKVLSSDTQKSKNNNFRLIKEFGLTGYIFMLIGSFVQRKVAKDLGIEPGIDMKTAYEYSRDKKIPTALIDRDIRVVLKEMSRIPVGKKLSMMGSLIVKSFKKEYREDLSFDPKTVPDDKLIEKALLLMKKELPDFYEILIESRNRHMCDRLIELSDTHSGYVLAVVGAGHVKGMEEILRNREKTSNSDSLSFSFKVDV